jgi:hypothetical protein
MLVISELTCHKIPDFSAASNNKKKQDTKFLNVGYYVLCRQTKLISLARITVFPEGKCNFCFVEIKKKKKMCKS